jgi:hypothetical protein
LERHTHTRLRRHHADVANAARERDIRVTVIWPTEQPATNLPGAGSQITIL